MGESAGDTGDRQLPCPYRDQGYPADDHPQGAEEVPLLQIRNQGCAHGGGEPESAYQALLSQIAYFCQIDDRILKSLND